MSAASPSQVALRGRLLELAAGCTLTVHACDERGEQARAERHLECRAYLRVWADLVVSAPKGDA